MKRIAYILITLFAVFLVHSCTDEATVNTGNTVEGDRINLSFTTAFTNQVNVNTRSALDPTGTGINTLWLFNFDANGVYLGRTLATLAATGNIEGAFTAQVPSATRIIHFLANQNLDDFNDAEMNGRHENLVMNGLVSTSGSIVYWGRIAKDDAATPDDFATYFKSLEAVYMYRNLARITCSISEGTVDGLSVCNEYARGASIPFNSSTSSYPDPQTTSAPNFTTLPENRGKLSDGTDTDPYVSGETINGTYIFETPNSGEDALYVIVKTENKYYKVMLVDEDKDPIPIIRNHSYNIQFTAAPTDGYDSFSAAREGVAYNNVIISIDEDIPSVTVGDETLSVENTNVILTGTDSGLMSLALGYSYNGDKTVNVSWVSRDEGISEVITHNTSARTITIGAIIQEGQVLRGKLQVKAGALVRYINVYATPKFEFTPVWTSNAISNAAAGEDVGFVFNIPDNYPQELLPVRCLITADQLSGSGVPPLSVINREDCLNADGTLNTAEYGGENDCGYKYVYEANSTGMHRIYFSTNLVEQTSGEITLEAQYFNKVTKEYTYVEETNNQLSITGEPEDDIRTYTGTAYGSTNATIYYKLVPRYVNTPVSFNLGVGTTSPLSSLPTGTKILIYTRKLKPDNITLEEGITTDGLHYYVYVAGSVTDDRLTFVTTDPICEETVRFASVNDNVTTAGIYKSTTLELSNFRNWETELASIQASSLTYGTGRDVTLSFNLKAFTSTDSQQNPAKVVEVTPPVGTFPIHIYTENLEPATGMIMTQNQDADGKTYYVYEMTTTQGEDKVDLNFQTKNIVSAETVTIKPDLEFISFNEANIAIVNAPITGTVTYGNDASSQTSVPQGSFVTLIRGDGTRIGTVTVGADGSYSLVLRSEYSFGWDTVLHMYGSIGGNIYSSGELTLRDMVDNSNTTIQLIRE